MRPPVHQPEPTGVYIWEGVLRDLSPYDLAITAKDFFCVIGIPDGPHSKAPLRPVIKGFFALQGGA